MSNNLYRCTPRQVRGFVKDCWEAGVVPNVISSPGIGKSTIIRGNTREFNLSLIDHRLSTSQPEDLSGLPEFRTIDVGTEHERRIATFTPFDLFPTDRTPLPKDKDGNDMEGWAIFFDEFNSGTKEIQAACYKIILDRMVGQYPLHENVVMACAGNLMSDRAITNDLSTAMQSRLVHIEMEFNFQQWYEDVALAQDYDERIIAMANFDNDFVMDFRPDHQDKTFCCPRTIEFLNRLVKGKPVTDDKTALYAGTITANQAAQFVQFCEIYKEMMTIEDILKDPSGAPIPGHNEMERKWAITTHLMKRITDENLSDVATYVDRLDMTFRIMFYRSAVHNKPELRRHPAYIKALTTMSRHLNS